jgi:RNA polymerase sigma-70 factor (ECF subfamily)
MLCMALGLPIVAGVARAASGSERARDADVAWGLAAREPWAIAEAWRRFAPMVLATAHRFLGSRTEADDVVQEVFWRVFRQAPSLREPERLRSFVHGFALRVLKAELRRRRGGGWFPLLEGEADVPFEASDFESRNLLAKLQRLLDRLTTRDRLVFILRRIEAMTADEVAATMDISISTVKRSMARTSTRLSRWVAADADLAELARGDHRGRRR